MPPAEQSEAPQQLSREPLTAAKRKRLQQCFEYGSKQMAQENYDYATKLFTECVLGDPSNLSYVQSFLGNLQKKYDNNKTGSRLAKLKERGARGAIRKAARQEQWYDVISNGLKVLAVNPWDIPTLRAMATASEQMGDDEPEMAYLRAALAANSKDPNVNRHCAMALAARQQFDQAIACWHRVSLARPDDEEAQRAIASLAVEKTIVMGKYDETDATEKLGKGGADGQPEQELTIEQKLQQKIKRDPQELANYFELSQVYINNEQYKKAREILAAAFEVSDGDEDVRERMEDAELRHLRQQISSAESDGDLETKERLRKELNEKELDVYQKRCERHPNNLAFKYDLGLRYQITGQYNEAIKEYQQARNDPRRKGLCLLALGQCFQQIEQYRLAASHYDMAVQEIPDRDAENRKKALYLAGKLAIALKDLDRADKHLSALAALDFTYKDVSALLDKVAELRKNE